MKHCTHCLQFQRYEQFTAHRYTLDGLQSWCKDCTRGAGTRYRLANREKLNLARAEKRARLRTLAKLTPVL